MEFRTGDKVTYVGQSSFPKDIVGEILPDSYLLSFRRPTYYSASFPNYNGGGAVVFHNSLLKLTQKRKTLVYRRKE